MPLGPPPLSDLYTAALVVLANTSLGRAPNPLRKQARNRNFETSLTIMINFSGRASSCETILVSTISMELAGVLTEKTIGIVVTIRFSGRHSSGRATAIRI